MDAIGAVLQVLAFIVCIGGIVLGLVSASSTYSNGSGISLIVAGFVGGVSLFVIGSVLVALDQITQNAKRSADANERTAQAIEQLLMRDIYAPREALLPRQPSKPTAVDTDALLNDIEANRPQNKPRATVLRRLDEQQKPPGDSK